MRDGGGKGESKESMEEETLAGVSLREGSYCMMEWKSARASDC